MKPIYEPKTRAKEYCELAINIYTGCNHGCIYCYARKMAARYTPKDQECSFDKPVLRPNIVEFMKKQLASGKYRGKLIQLCFTCDPYPAEIDTTPTREIITAIKEAGAFVQILTKGGKRAERDFDLLDNNDWFGVTISGLPKTISVCEPNAAPNIERIGSLKKAHWRGIKTWVSCEPVLDELAIYNMIGIGSYVNLFKIGKLNYMPSDIDWGEFGRECERLLKQYKRDYYIKEDLSTLIKSED